MATPNITPFIPPLNTPSPGPNAHLQPPVVPPAPAGANPAYPQWAANPQTAGGYPVYPGHHPTIYPNTPYSAAPGTPFLPATTPATHHQYFPATGPPGAARPLPPFEPYPPFVPPMHSPWGPAAAVPPPMTPWGQPGTPWAQQGYPSPYPPAGGPPPMAPMMPPMGFARPMAYGGMGAGGPFTPAAQPHNMGDPWGAGAGPAPPPWAQQQMMNNMGMGMAGGMGLGFGPFGPGPYGIPEQPPMARAMGQGGDRVGQFAEGPHYGPVLEPFLVRAVHAHVSLNPLLAPADTSSATAPYLKWNMLFHSNQCTRSDDPPHISWSKGRAEPATFPRVTFLRLVSSTIPWPINVSARNRELGVSCGDVIDAISMSMYGLAAEDEFRMLPSAQKSLVSEAYRHNRSRANGVPGGGLSQGMLRLDWLAQDTMFGGVRENERLARLRCGGEMLPCTFELVCVKRYVMSQEELRAQEALQRNVEAARERERAARRRERSTVETVTDEDERGTTVSESSSEEDRRGRSRARSRRSRG
ncbi:hypothetical protein C8F01DRAFT_1133802 [Mycena amicta]|nr:hypothetical protein C8F01DRAFT_1133802 [Mycena amicta]